MPLVKLDIPAGIYNHGNDLDSKGRWRDSSLVRWNNNAPQPVGGFAEFANIEQLLAHGSLENSTGWTASNVTHDTTNGQVTFTAGSAGSFLQDISTDLEVSKVYVIEITVSALTAGSITPTVAGTTGSAITAAGTHTQEITLPGSFATAASTGFNTSSTAVGTVTSILVRKKGRQSRGAHAWTALDGSPYLAAGSYNRLVVLNGSGTVYDITPNSFTAGTEIATENLGYGGKTYGQGFYGVERERNYSTAPATTWSLDNWGEDLVACSDADGKLYDWDKSAFDSDPTTIAAQVTNAPTDNSAIVVTAERFVFCLGAGGNTRKVQWCDRENLTVWSPQVTNEAGDLELQTPGDLMAGCRVRGRTLLLTTTDCWTATYQGPPIVFGFQKIGDSCGLVGRNMLSSVGPAAFWMGNNNFFVYDGSTAQVLPCEVHDKVFTEMNRDKLSHGWCVSNQKYNEVWWFYPGESADEPTRYVAYDYREQHWLIGSLTRVTGDDSGSFDDPLWVGDDGKVYRQELGYGHGGSEVFLESGPINFADGENVARVTELIPEEKTQGDVSLTFKTRFYPNDSETTHGPFNPANPTSVRFTGRQLRMRIVGDAGQNWRLGDVRLRVTNGGQR